MATETETNDQTESENSWLSWATSARVLGHPVVWSAITAVFILIGYFWLQYYAAPYAKSLGQEQTDPAAASFENKVGSDTESDWNPEIYKDIETEEVMALSKVKDENRAENYRRIIELEGQILPLLSRARQYIDSENYVLPTQDNAWEMYNQVLALDPAHHTAISGKQQLIQILQSNAKLTSDEGYYDESEGWLTQLDKIKPGHTFQTDLRNQIAAKINQDLIRAEEAQQAVQRANQLKSTLADAQNAMQEKPANLRAAFDLYSRVLEIESENGAAKSGLNAIHEIRINRAKVAIAKNNFDEAQQEINRLNETDATQEDIKTLTAYLQSQTTKLKQQQAAAAKLKQQQLAAKLEEEQRLKEQLAQQNRQAAATNAAEVTNNTIDTTTTAVSPKDIASLFPEKPVEVASAANEPISPSTPPNSTKEQQLNNGIKAYYSGNYNAAFEMLHPLAEDGVSRAQFRVGIMYLQGRTVAKNRDLATKWVAKALPIILRAAQQDVAWAQSDLGTAYEMGVGVKKDLTRSASWYTKAAKAGYAGAQTNLGVLYGTGDGVKYDRQLALYWLKKAATQGDKVAKDNLRILNAR